jgi:hypothetical protein
MPTWFEAKTAASDESSHGQGGRPEENQSHDQRHESQNELGSIRHQGHFAPNFSTSLEEVAKSRTPTDSMR